MIRHSISIAEQGAIPNEALRQVHIIKQLKDNGFPIVGHIAIDRVERGSLTITTDELFGEVVYEFREPGEA